MLSSVRLSLLLASALLLLPLAASAQLVSETVFDPADAVGIRATLSGDDDCGLDPQHCGNHYSSVSAQRGQLNQHLSNIQFGYRGGEPCSVSAPPPTHPTYTLHNRTWNECNGSANSTERLNVDPLPGPDYGLNRLRICTDNTGKMVGAEARFYKLPHLGLNAPGQNAVTERFERNSCSSWQAWSACPLGTAASRIGIYTESQTASQGGIQGIQLTCTRVISSSAR